MTIDEAPPIWTRVPKPTGKITANGRYDMPLGEYMGQPCTTLSMSSSDARTLSYLTPAHLIARWNEEREAEKKADFGTAVHCMVLEPLRTERQIVIVEADNYKTKDAREARDAATAAGKTPLLSADAERARVAADAVRNHPDAARYLRNAVTEQAWFAKDEKTGVIMKARPDIFSATEALADIKTVGSCDEDFLKRRVYDGGWYQQAPWHCHVAARVLGRDVNDYVWICVEQDPPHAVRVVRPMESALIHGAEKNERAIRIFAECVKTGRWPGYPRGIVEMGLPDYAYFRLENDAAREHDTTMAAAKYADALGASPFG